MNRFTIRDIENLSEIKAHTWRIWEQRHNICLPQRKESNHRFYDAANLKQVLRIAYLYHSGIKISKIAGMNEAEIIAMARQYEEKHLTHYFIKELLEAALETDYDRFDSICEKVFTTLPGEEAVVNVFYPYLEKVGMLWLTDHIVPAQEHFTSNIIRHKLLHLINQLPATGEKSETTIVFSPEKEHHELPLLFIHYMLKSNGKKVVYFGCNIKTKDLQQYLNEREGSILHFHLITNLTNKSVQQYLDEIAAMFRGRQIVMSGPMTKHIQKNPANCRVLLSLQEMLQYAKQPVV